MGINASHGKDVYLDPKCGNRSGTCTDLDIQLENGCHIKKDDCLHQDCCDLAREGGLIPSDPRTMPTLAQIYDACNYATTTENNLSGDRAYKPCFEYMASCLQNTTTAEPATLALPTSIPSVSAEGS